MLTQISATCSFNRLFPGCVPAISRRLKNIDYLASEFLAQRRSLSYTIIQEVKPQKSQDQNSATTNKKKAGSKHRKERGQSTYKFVDRVRLNIQGGAGGKGCTSFYRYISGKRRPDGGNGGHGGAVILIADPKEQTLRFSRHHIRAQSGTNGSSNGRHGRNGRNTVIRVPCGVVVRRVLEFHEVWHEQDGEVRYKEGYVPVMDDDDEEEEEDDVGEGLQYDAKGCASTTNQDDDTWEASSDGEDDDGEDDDDDDDDDWFEVDNELEDEQTTERSGLWTKSEDGLYSASFSRKHVVTHNPKFGLSTDVASPDEEPLEEESSNTGNEERERILLSDLDKPGSYVIVARGGHGGIGNQGDASRRYSPNLLKRAVRRAKSTPGESVFLELELKLIADLGLVGFPNAGKSSLLAAMSRAQPEIAPYPFTTLHPLVGVIEYRDGFRVGAADVPGLIEGAHKGRGRGYEFLRHLERTKALLYIVDAAGVDGRNPLDDIRILAEELASYGNGELIDRNALVVANKLDLILDGVARQDMLLEIGVAAEEAGIKMFGDEVIGISAGVTGEGLSLLSKEIRSIVVRSEAERLLSDTEVWSNRTHQ